MAVLTETEDKSILDQVREGEQLVHTHSHSHDLGCAVTFFADPDEVEADGSHKCHYCDYTVEYPDGIGDSDYSYYYEADSGEFVCGEEGCSWSSESDKAVKGHQTREHIDEEDEETETENNEQENDNGQEDDDEGNGDDEVDE